jgi:hypothetical protein
MKTSKLEDIPKDVFEQRGVFFLEGIGDRVKTSNDFLKNEYGRKLELYECTKFMDYVYQDAFIGNLNYHGDYPVIESHFQFDYSIKHALSGSYKAAFDHLRSIFELTVLNIYFSIEKVSIKIDESNLEKHTEEFINKLKTEKNWFYSEIDTPFFSTMISKIRNIDRIVDFDKEFNWLESFKGLFKQLSNITHTKGFKNGIYGMNQINNRINNSSYHSVNTESLSFYFDVLIEIIENIAVLLSLYNPIILVELPIQEKFGDNYPIGFLLPNQVKILNSIIPEKYQAYFDILKQKDEEVLGKKYWVENWQIK